MRKAVVFLLLAAFLVNAGGYFSVYRFEAVKKSNAHQKYLSNQQTLRISAKTGEAELLKKGFKRVGEQEYVKKGKRYDVIKKTKKGLYTTIYLAHDSKEQELLHFLTSFFRSSATDAQYPASTKLKHDILKQYVVSGKNAPQVYHATKFIADHFINHSFSEAYKEVPLPPPKFFA